jgi:hypothetical protein
LVRFKGVSPPKDDGKPRAVASNFEQTQYKPNRSVDEVMEGLVGVRDLAKSQPYSCLSAQHHHSHANHASE